MAGVAEPAASFLPLRIVSDEYRAQIAIKIDQRRKPVPVGHHIGAMRLRQRAYIARERRVGEQFKRTALVQPQAGMTNARIHRSGCNSRKENQPGEHDRGRKYPRTAPQLFPGVPPDER